MSATVAAGERPGIPLDTEPVGFFHPLDAGAGPVAGDDTLPPLDEAPALWPEAGRP